MRGKLLAIPLLPVLVLAPWMLLQAGPHLAPPADAAEQGACPRGFPDAETHEDQLSLGYDRSFRIAVPDHGCVWVKIDMTKAMPVHVIGDLDAPQRLATCGFDVAPLSSCEAWGDGSGTATLRVHGSGTGVMVVQLGAGPHPS